MEWEIPYLGLKRRLADLDLHALHKTLGRGLLHKYRLVEYALGVFLPLQYILLG